MFRNKVYYELKPFVPRRWRNAVRRRIAIRQRNRSREIWPIAPGSEKAPSGWMGWPEGKRFAVVLTHDVEGKAGLMKCRSLMALEQQCGFRSSFNFIPKGNYALPDSLRNELVGAGFEVGVHDLTHDGRLFRSAKRFRRHAIQINDCLKKWNAVGFRSAFMLHNLDWLHQLDIEYDLSTFDTDPFEPQPEGRHTIFPFFVGAPGSDGPSHNGNKRKGYVELPYTLAQDSTLFLLLRETSTDIWKEKIDWIAKHGGMVLLNTHPDYMEFGSSERSRDTYPANFYREVLNYLRSKYERQFWHALPSEVGRYFARIEQNRESSQKLQVVPPRSAGSRDRSYLRGKRAAVLLFSYFPGDSRPRRAAEALAAEGLTVEIFCLQRDATEPRHEQRDGIEVIRIPIPRKRGSKLQYLRQYSAFILRSGLYLTRRSLCRRYQLLHVHNMPDALVFAAIAPKIMGAKIILDLHDPMPELMQTIFDLEESSLGVTLLKYLEKISIGFADVVLTVNRACERIFTTRGCDHGKIRVIMNAPDTEIFRFQEAEAASRNGKDPADHFSILYHGSLVPRNGFDLAVEALAVLGKRIPATRLVVCGEKNEFFEKTMQHARDRGLDGQIDYLGVLDQQQVSEAIRDCDIGIVPNQRNTFTQINTPTRIFEYLSLGKPVVAPRTLGIEDYFKDDEILFFEAGDSADLARQIEFAYANRLEVRRVVERGQQVYLANNWDRQRESLLDAVCDLLSK